MLDYNRDVRPYLELGADMRPPANLRHTFYQASINHRDRLRAVFAKKYPDYLNINRPKERDEYKEYRGKIYRNPMRSLRRRTIEALDYIRQADDFDVSFPKLTADAPDSLEKLVTDSRYTKDGSLIDWFFARVRKKYVDDPNAVLVMLPLTQPLSDAERVMPTPMLIKCDSVYQHRKGEFAVLEAPERTWIVGASGRPEKTGRILIFVDHESYCIARQLQQTIVNNESKLTWDITGMVPVVQEIEGVEQQTGYRFQPPLHNCPVMPVRSIGKINEDDAEEKVTGAAGRVSYQLISSNDEGEVYYESMLADALPHIEGVQEVGSDIQVERNFHISSQEWRFGQKRCPDSHEAGGPCVNGQIPIRNDAGDVVKSVKCKKCDGGIDTSGSGVSGLIIVSAPSATSIQDEGRPVNLPTPPGGFIPRPIEPLQEFVKEFDREKKGAYETINMQFLMESPIDQSGTAKRMDREELYRTLIVHGAHLCGLAQFLFECAAYQRKQEAEAPAVLAPVRLSIENSEITRQELVEAVDKEFDSNLRAPLEKKLIEYQSGKDSDYYRRYELREQCDPYKNINFESKLFLLSAARLTMDVASEQYKALSRRVWLSVNFDGLVSDQLRSGEGFWNLSPDQQYEKLLKGVEGILSEPKPVQIDPKTGLPTQQEGQLIPIADLKNANQLS